MDGVWNARRSGCRALIAAQVATAAMLLVGETVRAALTVNPAPGYNLTWDGNDGVHFNPANPAPVPSNLADIPLAASFSSSDLGANLNIPFHRSFNANDGLYGNANSWIGGNGDGMPTLGVALGGERSITSIAWGRDNGNNPGDCCGGQLTDRSMGLYTLQITNAAVPQLAGNAEWTTVGTLDYGAADDAVVGGAFTPWYRHEFGLTTSGGDPVAATGVRLLVPASGIAGGTAVDEIEVYGAPAPLGSTPVTEAMPTAHLRGDVGVSTTGGNVFQWNDQSGNGNHAFANFAMPPSLADDAIGGLPAVRFDAGTEHVNLPSTGDLGLVNSDYEIFVVARSTDAGIQFLTAGGSGNLEKFELHLNGAAGARFIPETFGGGVGAADIGAAGTFTNGETQVFNIRVEGDTGYIRVNGAESGDIVAGAQSSVNAPQLTLGVRGDATFPLRGDMGEVVVFDRALTMTERRDIERSLAHKWGGVYLEETGGGLFEDNVAAQSAGGKAFAQDVIPGFPSIHNIMHLNDETYGNSNSWIGANNGQPSFAGVAFDGAYPIDAIAFGRDNGGEDTQFTDRVAGTYTLQYTTDELMVDMAGMLTNNPQWFDIADLTYNPNSPTAYPNDPYLRHAWSFSTIENVTGVRVLVSNNGIAIDELEVRLAPLIPEPMSAGLLMLGIGALAVRRRSRA